MANPQKENGFTKIANEILDALVKWHLSGYEWRVLLILIRKTYGWNKKADWISLSQFSEATGIAESHVSRALNMLLKQNIVTKGGNYKHPLFGLQKDWEKWIELPKGVRSHHPIKITKGGNLNLPKGVIHSYQRGGIQKKVLQKTLLQKNSAVATPTADEPFNQTEYIKTLLDSKQKHLQIIGLYFEQKRLVFPTKAAIQAEIKRNVRPATALVGWDSKAIINTMVWLESQKLTWGLEAIVKNIARVNS